MVLRGSVAHAILALHEAVGHDTVALREGVSRAIDAGHEGASIILVLGLVGIVGRATQTAFENDVLHAETIGRVIIRGRRRCVLSVELVAGVGTHVDGDFTRMFPLAPGGRPSDRMCGIEVDGHGRLSGRRDHAHLWRALPEKREVCRYGWKPGIGGVVVVRNDSSSGTRGKADMPMLAAATVVVMSPC